MSGFLNISAYKAFKLPPSMANSLAADGRGNTGFIAGIITENGLPVVRRVICYHRKTAKQMAVKFSDDNGAYRFDGLIAGVKYFITSIDEHNDAVQYNAVTQDLITASEVTV